MHLDVGGVVFLGHLSMGVNATGTLGGSQVERRRRENRGGEAGVIWGGALCPFPENL